jgi:hypothetical protein
MFTLILSLLTTTGEFKTVDLQTEAPSYNACMNDQPSMAKFIAEHPQYKIVRWHCVDITKKKLDI